jgi:hypothetical protein
MRKKDNKRIKKETIKIHWTHFKKRKVRKYSNNRQIKDRKDRGRRCWTV